MNVLLAQTRPGLAVAAAQRIVCAGSTSIAVYRTAHLARLTLEKNEGIFLVDVGVCFQLSVICFSRFKKRLFCSLKADSLIHFLSFLSFYPLEYWICVIATPLVRILLHLHRVYLVWFSFV